MSRKRSSASPCDQTWRTGSRSTSGRCRSGSHTPGCDATGRSGVRLDAGPLRIRNFRLLFAARSISYFGTYLAPIAVAFAVLDLTGSASDTGIAFACWTLAQVSTLMVGGVIADRLPRRLVMVGSDAGNLCVRTVMGVLLISGHAHVWEIFVLQALGGAATAFYSPASSGLVPEVVDARQLQQANSFMGIARYLAFPLGAATGGAIVATIGSGTALLVDGGTYAASALLLSGFRLGPVQRPRRTSSESFGRAGRRSPSTPGSGC